MKTQTTTVNGMELIDFEVMDVEEQINCLLEQIATTKDIYSYEKKNYKIILKQLKVIGKIISNLDLMNDIGDTYNESIIEIVDNKTTTEYNELINKYSM